jgi:hypothetical protein
LELVVDGPTIFCMDVLRVIMHDWKLDRMIFYGDSLFLDQTEAEDDISDLSDIVKGEESLARYFAEEEKGRSRIHRDGWPFQ